jgi:hypothetical protein
MTKFGSLPSQRYDHFWPRHLMLFLWQVLYGLLALCLIEEDHVACGQ